MVVLKVIHKNQFVARYLI